MTLAIPQFGQRWEGQGGILVATMPAIAHLPARHIIAADAITQLAWGGYGDEVEGAASRIDGIANTRALMADKTNEHPAAKFCAEFVADGHSDFFLGSQADFFMALLMSPATFEDGVYWTSTQVSRNFAFVQDFADGDSSWDGKNDEWRVRPFRQILVGA